MLCPRFIKREIRKFYIVLLKRRLKNAHKRVIHVQSCCFANLRLHCMFTLYGIAFRGDTKGYSVWYEQHRHRTGTSRTHTSNIVPEQLAERVWWSKSQSSLLNIYFRFSGLHSSLLLFHFCWGPTTCLHCTKVFGAAQLLCVAEIAPESPFLCANSALSGIVFVPAQML